jgi:hypothetical protein
VEISRAAVPLLTGGVFWRWCYSIFRRIFFPQMLGPLPKPPRPWSDIVRDLAHEPNTLRMAALMKELTEVDLRTFTNTSREQRRRHNEMALYPASTSPSHSITAESKRHKLDRFTED